MSSWEKYTKTLPLANKIYSSLFEEPSSHKEWVEKLNKVGDINKVLQDE